MNKTTKIIAGVATGFTLAGITTATCFGVSNSNLRHEHDKYVQESTLREEENQQKIDELEELNDILGEENQGLKLDIKGYEDIALEYSLTSSTLTASVSLRDGFENVKSLAIPEEIVVNDVTYTVTEISDSAFANCKNLSSIELPASIASIGSKAFLGCDSLTSIIIPSSVTTIGKSAFYDCLNLESVTGMKGLESIGSYSFFNCQKLSKMTIPSSATSIGKYAFRKCNSLTSVTFEITEGWKVSDGTGEIAIDSASLEDEENAAFLLTSTEFYVFQTWNRSELEE